jgi:hypothetical protein
MKNVTFILAGIAILASFDACNRDHRDIKCQDFVPYGEVYWFPLSRGEQAVFVNKQNEEKVYTVTETHLSRTTNYTTSSNCACENMTMMVLTSGNDSILLENWRLYRENERSAYSEKITFVIDNARSSFSNMHEEMPPYFRVPNLPNLPDKEEFSSDHDYHPLIIKKVSRAKGIGITSFELFSGEVWTNKKLTATPTYPISFSHSTEISCY